MSEDTLVWIAIILLAAFFIYGLLTHPEVVIQGIGEGIERSAALLSGNPEYGQSVGVEVPSSYEARIEVVLTPSMNCAEIILDGARVASWCEPGLKFSTVKVIVVSLSNSQRHIGEVRWWNYRKGYMVPPCERRNLEFPQGIGSFVKTPTVHYEPIL
ncbi:MAG TPA: hypothetical protein ENG51_17955 [Deltaproteobacteria bacterium]|nr:MAG: hypothetical protein DRH15_01640 [Deltaproteobacteria bacterium]HDM78323.1 hypothetical protein [Deltaproteobacteria bacterium]